MDGVQIYNKPKIIEETPNRKKKKNNHGKNIANNNNNFPSSNSVTVVNKTVDEQDKVLNKILQYHPDQSVKTIQRLMQRYNNDINLILQEIVKEKQDFVDNSQISTQSSLTKNDYTMEEDLFMNLQSEVEIEKNQFEELFDEVCAIIQDRNDITSLQKNHMIENCKDQLDKFVKLTVGFQQEMNIADLTYEDLSEREELLTQVQLFIEAVSKERNTNSKNAKYKNNEEEFPTLGKSQQVSIVDKLSRQYKQNQIEQNKMFQKKNQYFNAEKKKNIKSWQEENSHFFLGDNFSDFSSKDIETLSREYEGMQLIEIKIIYSLLGDMETCRRFLKEFYKQRQSMKRKIQLKPKTISVDKNPMIKEVHETKETVNHRIMRMSLEEIRDIVNHNLKLRVVFLSASQKLSSYNEKKKLEFIANQYNGILSEYMKASKLKFLERAKQENPLEIDLHGYFANEAVDIVKDHIQNIIKQFKNCHPKIWSKYRNGKLITELVVITGKGLHSKHKQSVLKPAIERMCDKAEMHYEHREGTIVIRINLN